LRGLLDHAEAGPDDAALVEGLRGALAVQGGQTPAVPDRLAEQVRDGQRAGRRHLAGLAGLLAFLVLVVLLVVTLR
jgi:hypothetical protein